MYLGHGFAGGFYIVDEGKRNEGWFLSFWLDQLCGWILTLLRWGIQGKRSKFGERHLKSRDLFRGKGLQFFANYFNGYSDYFNKEISFNFWVITC